MKENRGAPDSPVTAVRQNAEFIMLTQKVPVLNGLDGSGVQRVPEWKHVIIYK